VNGQQQQPANPRKRNAPVVLPLLAEKAGAAHGGLLRVKTPPDARSRQENTPRFSRFREKYKKDSTNSPAPRSRAQVRPPIRLRPAPNSTATCFREANCRPHRRNRFARRGPSLASSWLETEARRRPKTKAETRASSKGPPKSLEIVRRRLSTRARCRWISQNSSHFESSQNRLR
jgi:hypothetical protein